MSKNRANNRPERTPLHKQRLLGVSDKDKDPNYVYRMVNEESGRVENFLDAGWEPVSGDVDTGETRVQDASQMGSVVRRVVNKDPQAHAKTAILMRKPKEWFDVDMAEKQKRNDEIEAAFDPRKAETDGNHYGAKFEKKIQ